MADIFDEVEQDLRRDRLQKVWDRFAPVIVGVAVLIVVVIGGWRVYQYLQAERAAADGARYQAAMGLSAEGKHAEAAAAFAALAQDGTAGYRTVARLRAAAELAGTDPKAAIPAYDAYAGDNAEPAGLRDVARLRAGYLLVDSGTYAEARQRVEPLAVAGNPFRHGAREVLGLSAFRSGDWAEARRWFEALVSDAEAPPQMRQRADLVLDVIGSADKPPPVAPPPAPAIDIFAPPAGGPQALPSLTAPILPTLPSTDAMPSFEPLPATPEAVPPAVPEGAAPPAEPAPPPAAPAPESVSPSAPPSPPEAVPPATAEPTAPPAAPPAEPAAPAPEAAPPAEPAPAPPAAESPAPASPSSGEAAPVVPQPDGATPPANAGPATDAATPPPASSSESPQ